MVPCSSLTLAMFGKEIRLCLGVSLLVGFGVAFCWEGQGQHVPCRLCGGADNDGHLFWECTFPPLVEIREHPEFHGLVKMDKSCWPWCLLWHGWLPLLSGVNGGSPWAENPAEGRGDLLECALGPYTSGLLVEWQLRDVFDALGTAKRVAAEPHVWTDGSLVEDKVSGASSLGSFFLLVVLVIFGPIVGGAILMMMLAVTGQLSPAVFMVLFLVFYRLFRGLSSGGHPRSSGC